jgi:hypothetical protein
MINNKIVAYLALFLTLLFAACKKGAGNDPFVKVIPKDTAKAAPQDTTPVNTNTANVYVGGTVFDSLANAYQAVYWKNQVPVVLTHIKKTASVNAITVQGNDVYAAGYVQDENSNYIAAYWKNGVQVNLTDNTTSASTSAIVIQGNDIYVTGFVDFNAVYWKNGQRFVLQGVNGPGGSTEGMVIQGSDIYISGNSRGLPTFWKNFIPATLPNSQPGYAGNIAVQNGDVYVTASYPKLNKANVTYWKNSIPVTLGDGTIAILATKLAVSGPDVYVACFTEKGGGYFKNDKLNFLSGSAADVYGIAVINNDDISQGNLLIKRSRFLQYGKTASHCIFQHQLEKAAIYRVLQLLHYSRPF